MYNADNLFAKLREIENLIREKTNPDGSCGCDLDRVMVSLEIARRMINNE